MRIKWDQKGDPPRPAPLLRFFELVCGEDKRRRGIGRDATKGVFRMDINFASLWKG
jgi:hypothetical protein